MNKAITGKDLAVKEGKHPRDIEVLVVSNLTANLIHQLHTLSLLQNLHLNYCKINKLTILNLPMLKRATLSSIGLQSLKLQRLPFLLIIKAQRNQLSSLDITGCEKLTTLICNENKLSFISSMPSSLQTLILSKNDFVDFRGVPVSSSLRKLALSHNHIQHLQGIGKFLSLRELRLNSNLIQELPSELTKLTKLQLLDLGNNKIATVSFQDKLFISNLTVAKNTLPVHMIIPHFKGIKILDNRPHSPNYSPQRPIESDPQPTPILDKSEILKQAQSKRQTKVEILNHKIKRKQMMRKSTLAQLEQSTLRKMGGFQ